MVISLDYKVILAKDAATGWFVTEVPELPGCISQGKTKAIALENIKDAIRGYLESMKKHPEEKVFENRIEIEAVSL